MAQTRTPKTTPAKTVVDSVVDASVIVEAQVTVAAAVKTVAPVAEKRAQEESAVEITKRIKRAKKNTKSEAKQTSEIDALEAQTAAHVVVKESLNDTVVAEKPAHVQSVENPAKGGNCLDYIRLWKSDKTAWKFNKHRQTWILNAMFSVEKMSKDDFAITKAYITGLTGAARETTIEKAEQLIKVDAKHERALAVKKVLAKAE